APHSDEVRLRSRVRAPGAPGFPPAPVTKPHAGGASVCDQFFFRVVTRAILTAVVDISALQDLRDGMRASARQLRLFVTGDHFQDFDATAFVIQRDASGNRHLREHKSLYLIAFKQLIDKLPWRHFPQPLEVSSNSIAFQPLIDRAVRLWRVIIVWNQKLAD